MAELTATAVVAIDSVEVNGESDYVYGANVDSPGEGVASDAYTFPIEGWILSRALRVERIEVLHEERPVAVTPLDFERRDIGEAFPQVEGAERSGFRLAVNSLRLPAEFELVIRAKLEDDTRLPLARLRGSRRRLPASPGGEIQPLMVNTIGRSGSTLLVTLLSSHPDVVAFSPFIKDARVSTYWTNVMQELAEPSAYLAPFDPPDLDAHRWWLDGGQELGDEEVERWLGSESVDSLVAMTRAQIEAFYAHVAGAERPRFFVEKFLPHQLVPDLLGEIYPGAREVVLVRDFRDMLCSVIAFTRKRGWDSFGRTEGGDDAEYVRTTLRESGEILSGRLKRAAARPCLVRYEDLVLDPEPALAALFAELGLSADPELVAMTVRRAKEDTAAMDHHRTSSDPAASIGRWRQDLPEEIAQICEEELGALLHEFGYLDS